MKFFTITALIISATALKLEQKAAGPNLDKLAGKAYKKMDKNYDN